MRGNFNARLASYMRLLLGIVLTNNFWKARRVNVIQIADFTGALRRLRTVWAARRQSWGCGNGERWLRASRVAGWFAVALVPSRRLLAEDSIGYRYAGYGEERGRVQVATQGISYDTQLNSHLSVKGDLIYDSISGATPTGAPPPTGSKEVPTVELHDIRRAVSVAPTWQDGRYSVTPQFAYSKERDYESYGVSLNQSFEFNQKNTTLNVGIARDFDRVLPNLPATWLFRPASKDNTDVLVGVNQLLDANTYVSLNVTLGYSSGQLADPYKRVVFGDFGLDSLFQEKRPSHKFRQVAEVSLTHFFKQVNGSSELSYRLHHDSYDIFSHTLALAWHQKIGERLILTPMVRYYEQSAASFYYTIVPGNPYFQQDPEGSPAPDYYSADFRLARLRSWTYGVTASWRITHELSVEGGYQRYEMQGLDGITAASAFPKANLITGGLRYWF